VRAHHSLQVGPDLCIHVPSSLFPSAATCLDLLISLASPVCRLLLGGRRRVCALLLAATLVCARLHALGGAQELGDEPAFRARCLVVDALGLGRAGKELDHPRLHLEVAHDVLHVAGLDVLVVDQSLQSLRLCVYGSLVQVQVSQGALQRPHVPFRELCRKLAALDHQVAERTLERGASMRRPVLGDSVR
jgi:hypothetical protein